MKLSKNALQLIESFGRLYSHAIVHGRITFHFASVSVSSSPELLPTSRYVVVCCSPYGEKLLKNDTLVYFDALLLAAIVSAFTLMSFSCCLYTTAMQAKSPINYLTSFDEIELIQYSFVSNQYDRALCLILYRKYNIYIYNTYIAGIHIANLGYNLT